MRENPSYLSALRLFLFFLVSSAAATYIQHHVQAWPNLPTDCSQECTTILSFPDRTRDDSLVLLAVRVEGTTIPSFVRIVPKARALEGALAWMGPRVVDGSGRIGLSMQAHLRLSGFVNVTVGMTGTGLASFLFYMVEYSGVYNVSMIAQKGNGEPFQEQLPLDCAFSLTHLLTSASNGVEFTNPVPVMRGSLGALEGLEVDSRISPTSDLPTGFRISGNAPTAWIGIFTNIEGHQCDPQITGDTIPAGEIRRFTHNVVLDGAVVDGHVFTTAAIELRSGVLQRLGNITSGGAMDIGDLTVHQGGTLKSFGSFNVRAGATLTPVITQNPGSQKEVTFTVANFQSRTATEFATVNPAQATFSGSECFGFGTPTQTYDSTTLTTTIAVEQTCGGLSVGVIAGIAAGCVVVGALVAVLVVFLIKRSVQNSTNQMQKDLLKEELSELKYEHLK